MKQIINKYICHKKFDKAESLDTMKYLILELNKINRYNDVKCYRSN